jgi:hypothetical protein
MKATDLQMRLAQLAPGETLLVFAAELEEAFPYQRTPEACRAAAAALAELYRCNLESRQPEGSEVAFVRQGD